MVKNKGQFSHAINVAITTTSQRWIFDLTELLSVKSIPFAFRWTIRQAPMRLFLLALSRLLYVFSLLLHVFKKNVYFDVKWGIRVIPEAVMVCTAAPPLLCPIIWIVLDHSIGTTQYVDGLKVVLSLIEKERLESAWKKYIFIIINITM